MFITSEWTSVGVSCNGDSTIAIILFGSIGRKVFYISILITIINIIITFPILSFTFSIK